uniref:Uncharacterized protein n=1 Tax=Anopheles atroparvus TaxID=41427 RepID=A0AAG5D2B2_ANOAO
KKSTSRNESSKINLDCGLKLSLLCAISRKTKSAVLCCWIVKKCERMGIKYCSLKFL